MEKIKDEADCKTDMSCRQALNELLRIVNNDQLETICVKDLYEKVYAACEKADHDDIFR